MRIKLLYKSVSFIFLFTASIISAQTKKEMEKIFKNSISQPKKSKIIVGQNSWKICVDTSSNTINLFETKFEKYSDCCRYDEWTFYKKNKFIKTEAYSSKEPPYSKVTTQDDWYEIEYVETENLVLVIKSEKRTDKFIVKELQKRKDNLHIIKLVKI